MITHVIVELKKPVKEQFFHIDTVLPSLYYGFGTPMIRCRDCKHNRDGICGWHYGVSPVDGYRWVVDDDDFCSCGERKEE